MAPNNSLLIDSSNYGDALHRDLYVRDTYQTSTDAILNEYFRVQNGVATAIAAKQVQLSSGEGAISLFTAGAGTSVNVSTDQATMFITLSETDINSAIVNFAGTGVNLTNTSATFSNAGTTSLLGNATVGGTLGVTGTATLSGATHLVGVVTADSGVSFVSTTATFSNAGTTSLLGDATVGGTLGVTGTTTLSGATHLVGVVTADSGVSFVSTTATFSNAGTTSLLGDATVGGTLGVTGTTTLSGATHLVGVVTADSGVSFVSTTATFSNAGTTSLLGDATVGGTLGVTGTTTLSGATHLVGVVTADSGVSFVSTTATFTNDGATILNGSLTSNGSASFLSTSSPFIVNGPVTFTNTFDVSGGLGFSGDLDMNANDILNLSTVSNGSEVKIAFNQVGTSVDTYIGTTAIFSVTSSGIQVNGDFTVTGNSTSVDIQSATVKVQDKNIELAYQALDLASCDGAGFTIGDSAADPTYTLPTFTYKNADAAFMTNQNLVVTDALDVNKRADLKYDSVVFSNTWRLKHDSSDDTMKIERYNGSAWVTKFTFTA